MWTVHNSIPAIIFVQAEDVNESQPVAILPFAFQFYEFIGHYAGLHVESGHTVLDFLDVECFHMRSGHHVDVANIGRLAKLRNVPCHR